nr:retrovirus-related Pol polyprotein from transposon TNT 1-94 [Tanacetum cinerariifolium]
YVIQCFTCKEFRHFAKECRKPKRVKDSTYHKEKMLLCKQAERGVPLQAEQYDWLADTDEEIDERELEAHYSCMAKIQENKQTEFEKYKAFNDRTIDYDKLERKLNEALGQLDLKDIKIKEDKNIAISELRKLIEKGKGKHVETKFDKPSVVQQPNAQWILKPSVLGKPAPFSNSLERIYFPKTKSVPKTYVSEGLSKPVTAQTLPQTERQAVGFITSKASITISSQLVNFVMRIWRLLFENLHALLEISRVRFTHRLSHLNFDYINLLSKKNIVIGLPKLEYVKDQLCSSCELSKTKRSSFKSKVVPSSKGRLNLLHMDLCGPMRVASINGKKYILVIVDDYSRYKGTEFLNKTLNAFFKEERIEHQTYTARTPEQNGVVERQNRTLVEAARTMLSA